MNHVQFLLCTFVFAHFGFAGSRLNDLHVLEPLVHITMVEIEGVAPDSYKKLRACVRCLLIKSEQQWHREGCENCEELELKGDLDKVLTYTTPNFEGLLSVINPAVSWTARWNHAARKIPGCYAISVERNEELEEDIGGMQPQEDDEGD